VGRQNGLSPEKLQALADHETSPLFDETERLALRYADAVTRTPVDVPEALFASLGERFSEAQLVELTAAIAWENYRARFDHAFGIQSEGFSEGAYCVLPARSAPARESGS
jgi:alkylhydroperoxidase family enzyme